MPSLPVLWELFLTFAKIGLFTFGGGYAMISLITSTCVEEKKWLTHDQMLELTVVAESTPGPIAINCATYAGYLQGGVWGSIAATVGMVLPSFTIIYLISMFLENVLDIVWVANAFRGIRVCVAVLIVDVGVAAIHRLLKVLPELQSADAVIAAAGMEGALPSVVAGLIKAPVIALPTSVGYGANLQGLTPMLAMLNSCASGVTVVNIDNGFGAACAAARIVNGKF